MWNAPGDIWRASSRKTRKKELIIPYKINGGVRDKKQSPVPRSNSPNTFKSLHKVPSLRSVIKYSGSVQLIPCKDLSKMEEGKHREPRAQLSDVVRYLEGSGGT